MTKDEFNTWLEFQQDSATCWQSDPIREANGRGYLLFRGGIDGTYLEITPDGHVTTGFYEGAFPHMGEATYRPQHEPKKLGDNHLEALVVAADYFGLDYMRDLTGIP